MLSLGLLPSMGPHFGSGSGYRKAVLGPAVSQYRYILRKA